jgi:hypothetical protein
LVAQDLFRKTVVHCRIEFGNTFVEFSNDRLRVASIVCLTLSVLFGVATLALVQEARRAAEIGAAAAIPVVARRPHLLRHRRDRSKSPTASSHQVSRLVLWTYGVRHTLSTLSSPPNRIMVRLG